MKTQVLLATLILLTVSSPVPAVLIVPPILSPSPDDAWNIFEKVGVGKGNSTAFEPLPLDYAGATLLGFYSDSLVSIGNGFGLPDEDTIRVISTFVHADNDLTVQIAVRGDDGHTVFLNGVQVLGHHGGGPAGGPHSLVDFNFQAGINTIEAAVYNGPGGSLIQLTTDRFNPSIGLISGVEGLTMNADGDFSAIPEPSSLAILGIGMACMAGCAAFRRRRHMPLVVG